MRVGKNRNVNFSDIKFERVRHGSRFGVEVGENEKGKRRESREYKDDLNTEMMLLYRYLSLCICEREKKKKREEKLKVI